MTTTTTNPTPQSSFLQTGVRTISQAARTMMSAIIGPEFRVLLVILALVVAWGLAIATWGYPALIVVALCLVPVMFGVLLLITVGK